MSFRSSGDVSWFWNMLIDGVLSYSSMCRVGGLTPTKFWGFAENGLLSFFLDCFSLGFNLTSDCSICMVFGLIELIGRDFRRNYCFTNED